MRKYGLLLLSLAMITILLLTGCGDNNSTTTTQPTTTQSTITDKPTTTTSSPTPTTTTTTLTPVSGGVLRISTDQTPSGSLGNPDKMGGSQLYMEMCIQPLLQMDGNGNAIPLLAESWTWSTDMLTLTLNLRHGVKFTDGSDFNADVVMWNLQNRIAAGGQGTSNIASYTKVDDYTVQIVIKTYQNNWLSNLRGTLGMQPSKYTWETKGLDYVNQHPVGAGPYVFKEYVENDHLTMVRNDNYWGKKTLLDEVNIEIIADGTTAQLAFENKEVDILSNIIGGGKTADQLKAKGFNIVTNPAGLSLTLVPSVSNANSPLASLKVRQAVEYAIDKAALAKAIGGGYYTAMYQEAGVTQKIYDPNFQGRVFDLAKAKALLTEAGYPNGFTVDLICGTNLAGDQLPIIQQMLAQANITANIKIVGVTDWQNYETNGWDGLLISPQAFSEAYAVSVNRYFTTPTKPNWSAGIYWNSVYRTNDLMTLCTEYFALPLGDAEVAKGRQIVKWLFDNCSFIPLYQMSGIMAMQTWVHDYSLPIPSGPVSFDYTSAWVSPH